MGSIGTFYTVAAILAVILQFFNHRFLGQGRLNLVYPISMVVFLLYFVVETVLALTNPDQIGILIFNTVNMWAFYNAYVGWRRLKKEQKEPNNFHDSRLYRH